MTDLRCVNCHWYRAWAPGVAAGQCRQDSPERGEFRATDSTDAVWPTVSVDDWCGQFAIRPEAKDWKP